jgi:hypothetical protein
MGNFYRFLLFTFLGLAKNIRVWRNGGLKSAFCFSILALGYVLDLHPDLQRRN